MEIVLMGPSKSGKSSIKKVVFEKLSPHESVFNEPTTTIESLQVNTSGYEKLTISEFPSSFTESKATPQDMKYFQSCQMIIYVFDCQDNTNYPFEYFRDVVVPILPKNKDINLAIFIHKRDSVNAGPTDFFKQKGELTTKFMDILSKVSEVKPDMFATSIYDYSLFETFSMIFQKMMLRNGMLSTLLDLLTIKCKFEKAYLFDVFNKIYLAIDSSPMESQTYEICSDMIDVVLDMSGIYGDENYNDSYFDENSMSMIKINNTERSENYVLYLRFIDSNLALITIVSEANFEKPHLLDFNIKLFREAVNKILKR